MAAVAATGGQLLIQQHHSQAHGLHHRQARGNGRRRWRSRTTPCWSAAPGHCSGPTSRPCPTPASPRICSPRSPAALCLAEGTSLVTEGVWNNRFRYVEELQAHGRSDPGGRHDRPWWRAWTQLTGAPVQACDLRAGAALVIAGLAAQGETEMTQVQYIERGYEDLVGKLRQLGADIRGGGDPGAGGDRRLTSADSDIQLSAAGCWQSAAESRFIARSEDTLMTITYTGQRLRGELRCCCRTGDAHLLLDAGISCTPHQGGALAAGADHGGRGRPYSLPMSIRITSAACKPW